MSDSASLLLQKISRQLHSEGIERTTPQVARAIQHRYGPMGYAELVTVLQRVEICETRYAALRDYLVDNFERETK